MAVIERRGAFQWRARVRRDGVQQSKTFTTRADAEAWAADVELKVRRGTWQDLTPAKQPFPQLAQRYLDEVTPTKKSGSREASRIRRLKEAPEFSLPISSITPAQVAAYRDRRSKEKVSAAHQSTADPSTSSRQRTPRDAAPRRFVSSQTVLHELNTLSAIWQHCTSEWSMPLPPNPVRQIRLPKQGRARDRRVSEEELQYLGKAATGTQGMTAILTLALETSMRLGELLSLRWRGIDLEGQVATLYDSKNGEGRSVALSRKAVAALRSIKPTSDAGKHREQETNGDAERRAAAEEEAAGRPPTLAKALERAKKAGRVFHWARSDSFNKTWRRTLARAREMYSEDQLAKEEPALPNFLQDLRWHDLRHEAVSRLFEKKLSAFEVAAMSGHKTMQMLKRYTHFHAAQIAKKLG
jgi:integrase